MTCAWWLPLVWVQDKESSTAPAGLDLSSDYNPRVDMASDIVTLFLMMDLLGNVPVFLAVLVAVFAWCLYAHRALVRRTDPLLVTIAVLMFGTSLAVDFVSDLGHYLDAWETEGWSVFVEDSFKWLAVVAWTTFLVRVAAGSLGSVTGRLCIHAHGPVEEPPPRR